MNRVLGLYGVALILAGGLEGVCDISLNSDESRLV